MAHQTFKTIFAIILTAGALVFSSLPAYSEEIQISMVTVKFIESSNGVNLFNAKTKATGAFQITPICLQDFNQYHTAARLTLNEMYDESKCFVVADWYLTKRIPQLLRHYGVPLSTRNILYAYNWGAGNVNKWYHAGADVSKLPKETREYYEKYIKREGGKWM